MGSFTAATANGTAIVWPSSQGKPHAKKSGILETHSHGSAMFCAIDRHCDTAQWLLELRICSAEDIATLWHLRPDLMQVIAVFRGEAIAREVLEGLSTLFEVVWPVKRIDPRFAIGHQ
jgi:hypothetical protein